MDDHRRGSPSSAGAGTTPFPNRLDAISPAWLSAALQEAFPGVEVTGVSVGATFEGSAAKGIIHVVYADGGEVPTRPDSFCVKGGFDRPHAEIGGPSYIVESLMYRDILPALEGVRSPRCYWAGIDEAGNQGMQLLEDLSTDGTIFSAAQEMSFDAGQVASLLSQLAELHGYWWRRPELRRQAWINDWLREGVFRTRFEMITEDLGAECLQRPRGRFVEGEMRDPAELSPRFWTMVASFEGEPEALIHCDAHFGNTYRTVSGDVGILDWQAARRGPVMHDVTFAVISSMTTEGRRASERDLIRHYLAEAAAHGVDFGDFDRAWEQYRRLAIYGFSAWLTTPLAYQPEEVAAASLKRFASAVKDLDSSGALGRSSRESH